MNRSKTLRLILMVISFWQSFVKLPEIYRHRYRVKKRLGKRSALHFQPVEAELNL